MVVVVVVVVVGVVVVAGRWSPAAGRMQVESSDDYSARGREHLWRIVAQQVALRVVGVAINKQTTTNTSAEPVHEPASVLVCRFGVLRRRKISLSSLNGSFLFARE